MCFNVFMFPSWLRQPSSKASYSHQIPPNWLLDSDRLVKHTRLCFHGGAVELQQHSLKQKTKPAATLSFSFSPILFCRTDMNSFTAWSASWRWSTRLKMTPESVFSPLGSNVFTSSLSFCFFFYMVAARKDFTTLSLKSWFLNSDFFLTFPQKTD